MTILTPTADIQPRTRPEVVGAALGRDGGRRGTERSADADAPSPFASLLEDQCDSAESQDESDSFQIDTPAISGLFDSRAVPMDGSMRPIGKLSTAPLGASDARQTMPPVPGSATAGLTEPSLLERIDSTAGGRALPLDGKILPQTGQLPGVATSAQASDAQLAAAGMPAGSDVSGADLHAAFTPVEHRALETALKASTARARAGSPAPFAQDASFGRPSHGTAGGDGVIDLLLSQQPGSGAAGQLPVITEPALTSASLANQFMAQAHTQSLGSQSLPDSARPAAGAQVFDALAASQMPLTLAGGESAAEPLGERLIALATQGQQFAKLRLHPAELGALEVRIKLHDDGAAISISSHHAHVRDAIEATLPRLRELFASQGMDLVDVDVSGGEQHAPQGGDGAMDRDSQSHQFQSARAELTAVQSAALAGDRLVARRSTHRIDLLA